MAEPILEVEDLTKRFGAIAAVSGLTLLVGRFADRSLLDQPPLEVLRAENS